MNAVTLPDSYELSRMDECIDFSKNMMVFSTLYANSGYWLTQVEEAEQEETAFTSHNGLHRLTRMPPYLKNSPEPF